MTLRAPVGDVSAQFALDANALGNLKLQAKGDPKQALAAASGQFEALFLEMLLKSMREALPQDGPLASDAGKTYTAMFDQQVAQQLSKRGIGIAALLNKQLAKALAPPAAADAPADAPTAAALAMPATPADRARNLVLPRSPSPQAAPARPAAATPSPVTAAPAAPAAATAGIVQGFIDQVRPYAEAVAQKLGVPAHFLIAQAGLETGWGRSQPRAADGAPSRNLFGIKSTAAWNGASVSAGTTEYGNGRMAHTTAAFRAYGSYSDSFRDFANLLQTSRRYAGTLANTHDPGKYAASLQQAGYATDPRYAEKLTRAIATVARYAPSGRTSTQVATAAADKAADLG
jgi:flagellar protein FlgJ